MKLLPLAHGKRILTSLTIVAVLALLLATLWPLNPVPPNEVSWVAGENAVRFGDYGTIFSASQFVPDAGAENEGFSLEFWMEPGLTQDSNAMVAFYVPENPAQFIVRQDESDISIVHELGDKKRRARPLVAAEVVSAGKPTLITVTADPAAGTTLYVDGVAKRSSNSFGLSRKNLSGELVVGNSPVGSNSWAGVLRGIAIYKAALTGPEVAKHFDGWRTGKEEAQLRPQEMIALYRFRDGSGSLVRNEVPGGVDLRIPPYFTIWRQKFLEPPWKEYQVGPVYFKDALMNVAGFVPFGLILFPFFLVVRESRRPWLMSYLCGAALSLAIEILQSFIPQRHSGFTDVITNSAGTGLGASIFLVGSVRRLLRKVFGQNDGKIG